VAEVERVEEQREQKHEHDEPRHPVSNAMAMTKPSCVVPQVRQLLLLSDAAGRLWPVLDPYPE
jgi:hypothetical protein